MAKNTVSLEWGKGMDQLMGYTTLKKYATENDVKKIVKNTTIEMMNYAYRRAAWRTGWMRDNFMIYFEDDGFTGRLTGEAPYTYFVEYGTSKQAAQPAIRAAFMIYRKQFLDDMLRVIDRRSRYGL